MDFYLILTIIILIVFAWIVKGPKLDKNKKASKKDLEKLKVEQILRRNKP